MNKLLYLSEESPQQLRHSRYRPYLLSPSEEHVANNIEFDVSLPYSFSQYKLHF